MKKLLLLMALMGCLISAQAQKESDAMKYAETITKEDMYDHLSILASDALEGRETGERGQKMAAAFISDHFKRLGLTAPVDGGYLQPVELYTSLPGNSYVTAKDQKFENFNEIVYFGSMVTDGDIEQEIVFVGNGTPEEFDKVDVKGKAVLAMVDNYRKFRGIVSTAKEKGAVISLVVPTSTDEEFAGVRDLFKNFLKGGRLSLQKPKDNTTDPGLFFVAPSVATTIFKAEIEKLNKAMEQGSLKKIKKGSFSYHTEREVKTVDSENVLGYLEGTDLKEELVVLTAHYDHIGRNGEEINNGADDDGSGTSAIMEMAEAFVKAKKEGKGPRRSILFMTVTGEEKGLLGSSYYAANPVFPLENTIVDLNIDMIGRIDEEHADDPNYVYLVGSDRLSTELHEISEKVNETYTEFNLDYTYNAESHPDRIYYRSDHWSFAKNNVPVIFYFNGVHEDYHKPTDTIDKIEFDLLTRRTKLVFHTAWVLANRDTRPTVDKIQDTKLDKN
ncbi:MAG: M28 family peptidase [Bacteroidota bacterium]